MIFRTSPWKLVNKLSSLRVRFHSDFPKSLIRVRDPSMKLGELQTMKLENELFRSILTPEMKIIEELFKKNGFELRIAGGAVRDLLMGISPHDIDFASTATPAQMKDMFTSENVRMINFGGERHGTITARINDKENFEITTLRIDRITDGRHAEVEFTTDWQMDANRRDLTVNAMFLSFDGTVYDYFNGREHLEQRKILFVGDAASRIQEDYLRILRYFRFYGRLAVDADRHDAATLDAIRLNSDGLKIISGERLHTELVKIADGGFYCSLICLMAELEVLQHLGFPQSPDLDEFRKVCDRSRELRPHAITKLTALTRTNDEAMALHARLKFSNSDKNLLLFLVRYRNSLTGLTDDEKLKLSQSLIYKRDIKGASIADAASWVRELLKYNGESETLRRFERWEPPKLPVGGGDVVLRGVPRGPKVTFVLDRLREIWLESDFSLGKEELLLKIRDILSEKSPKRHRSPSPRKSTTDP